MPPPSAPDVFNIPLTAINAGTTQFPFINVTNRVAGHTSYAVGFDVSEWPPSEELEISIRFRIDNGVVIDGCKAGVFGGVKIDPWTGQPFLPNCGSSIPAFNTRLEAAATVTAPSAHNISGTVTLR